jgi:hypothetical protein
MSPSRDPAAAISAWLEEGPTVLRDDVLAAALADVNRTRQRRSRLRWPASRGGRLSFAGLAVVATAVVAVGVIGVGLLGGPSLPAGPAPVPSASPSPSPRPTPVTSATIESNLYPYRWTISAPEVQLPVRRARIAWNDRLSCLAKEPCTDWVDVTYETPTTGAGNRWTFWGFGAPTDESLDAFAATMQERISTWMPCPAEPTTVRDLDLDGVPARLHAFLCTVDGRPYLHLRVFAVRDGIGLILGNAPLDAEYWGDAERDIDRFVADLDGFRWSPLGAD